MMKIWRNGRAVDATQAEIDQFTAERDANRPATVKAAIRAAMVERAGAAAGLDEGQAEFLAKIWPMLDKTAIPAELQAAKNIVVYGKTKIAWVDTASAAELAAYDPAADNGWPV